MPRPPKTPTSMELIREYPVEALRGQSTELLFEGEQHGLRVSLLQGKRTAQIKVLLAEKHYMLIRPVDKGAMGCAMWRTPIFAEDESTPPSYCIRAWVEVVDRRASIRANEKVSESFTVQGDSLKSVIISGLQAYAHQTGKVLSPLFIGGNR